MTQHAPLRYPCSPFLAVHVGLCKIMTHTHGHLPSRPRNCQPESTVGRRCVAVPVTISASRVPPESAVDGLGGVMHK